MRGLKQRTTPSDEFVATCSVCGAALRHVHVLHGRSGPRCSFCGSPLVSAAPDGRPPRPVAEDEGPLGLLTDFERPRRTSGRVLVTLSVAVLIAVAAVAFVRERGQRDDLAASPAGRPAASTPAPRDEPGGAGSPRSFSSVRVALAVTSDTWVEATQDGEVVESETLPPGERRTFQGDDEVTLRFYDGGGVRLRAGGRDIGTKGAGSTVEVRLWLDDEGRIQVERTYGV